MLPYLEILGRAIPMYWLCGLAGLLLAGALAMLRQRGGRFRTPADDTLHLLLLCPVGAMLGAKAFQVIGFLFKHAAHPGFWTLKAWLGVLSGGGVFYGGLIGALAAMLLYIRKYGLDVWDAADLLTPSIPLFHAFGRLGCFCAGCCYGRGAAWGVAFTHSLSAPNGVPLVPVQLFEAGFNLLVLAALLLLRPERKRPGTLLPLYLLAYAAGRFALEFLRGDASRGVFLLSTSQWISLALLPAAAALLVRRLKTERTRIKMVATDLDGTLLHGDTSISDYTISVLEKCRAKGIKIVYATARDAGATDSALLELVDGSVCSNGAKAYIDNTLVYSRTIALDRLHDLLTAAGDAGIELDIEPERILAIADEPEAAEAVIQKYLPGDLRLLVREEGLLLVILHKEATKAKGTAALAAHWGIRRSEIAAFGDDTIDIDLLRYCGVGVAVSNALDNVKLAADDICGSNDDDGVARWLEEHIL